MVWDTNSDLQREKRNDIGKDNPTSTQHEVGYDSPIVFKLIGISSVGSAW
jgi:hypothetical protein